MPSVAVQAWHTPEHLPQGASGSSNPLALPIELTAWMWSCASPETNSSPELLTLQI